MKRKICVFATASILFILIFPVIRLKIENDFTDFSNLVIIETTGTSNSKSSGTEVWIDGINADGSDTDLSGIELGKGWALNGRIYSKGDSQYYLKIKVQYNQSLQIRFIKHPYSGIVNIVCGEEKHTLDLFAEEETTEIYIIE